MSGRKSRKQKSKSKSRQVKPKHEERWARDNMNMTQLQSLAKSVLGPVGIPYSQLRKTDLINKINDYY